MNSGGRVRAGKAARTAATGKLVIDPDAIAGWRTCSDPACKLLAPGYLGEVWWNGQGPTYYPARDLVKSTLSAFEGRMSSPRGGGRRPILVSAAGCGAPGHDTRSKARICRYL